MKGAELGSGRAGSVVAGGPDWSRIGSGEHLAAADSERHTGEEGVGQCEQNGGGDVVGRADASRRVADAHLREHPGLALLAELSCQDVVAAVVRPRNPRMYRLAVSK